MKKPYHRQGKNSVFTSISNWWYCQYCDKMEVLSMDTIMKNLEFRNIRNGETTKDFILECPKDLYQHVYQVGELDLLGERMETIFKSLLHAEFRGKNIVIGDLNGNVAELSPVLLWWRNRNKRSRV